MNDKTINKRSQWSSRLGFILATTGAAVGVGNIWKFPYMAGDNGGSAFVLLYLLGVLIIGIPVMLGEMAIGFRGRCNQVDCLKKVAIEMGASPKWEALGWMGVLALLLVLSFYSVISGWSIAYLYYSLSGQIAGADPAHVASLWTSFISSPSKVIINHSVFMILTMWVVERGVQNGLEKSSKFMMPMLFLVLIGLDIYGATTSGFSHAWHFLFDLKLNEITGAVVISAVGHAFFTLAVGVGCMLVYASYVPRDSKIYGPVIAIAILDILVALLAGMAIFPIVFTYGLNPQGGPGLIFQTLPLAFATMPGGQIISALFFLLFIFAAWTSSISMAEPIVVMLAEKYLGTRLKATIVVGLVAWLIGLALCLSFNVWSEIKLFNRWDIFTSVTDLATNIFQPIGGFLFAIFAGFVLTKKASQDALRFPRPWLHSTWLFLIRYVAPIGILVVFLSALLD